MPATVAAPKASAMLPQVLRPPRPSALSNALVFGWRAVLKFKHVPEQLFDLVFDPGEAHNLIGDDAHTARHAELRGRLEAWMRDTGDPLLAGHVDPPRGVEINDPDQRSAADPTIRTG